MRQGNYLVINAVLLQQLETAHRQSLHRLRGALEEPINSRSKGSATLGLPPEMPTLPSLLKDAGYRTALIGKWGLSGPGSTGMPNSQGFEYFFGYLCQRHAVTAPPDTLIFMKKLNRNGTCFF